ncbi:Cas10/Cmr2 second palm domain-containing protein [Marinomonas sp.]|uniref:Cas10/Cmr2 second palm domain-containing protein n=1 Tax=Marinomonas sp. TaxID=1904862 RepID=UPI003BABE28C
MQKTAYLFEARSIQKYLFEGGKLRDMVAASDQLDALCNKPLEDVFTNLGLEENKDIWFSRRAGGSIYAILNSADQAKDLSLLWSLYVRKHFPGVEVVQVLSTADTIMAAMKAGFERLAEQRNRLSTQFPIAGPLVRRSPRTANPAVAWSESRKEWIDEATQIKQKIPNRSSLTRKFSDAPDKHWPKDLDTDNGDFPFLKNDRSVALIHADGNGLGELLRLLNTAVHLIIEKTADEQAYIELYQAFSKSLETAMQKAAQDATKVLLDARKKDDDMIPARPLVLGGDDLTILVRADLAIPFTQAFCLAFEEQTQQHLAPLYDTVKSKLGGKDELTVEGKILKLTRLKTLTACAGVCFIKSNQPFLQAHDLAESLCKEAKKQSRQWQTNDDALTCIPSSISFHQVAATMIEDVKSVREHEWKIPINGESYELSMGCYGFKDGLTNLATLQAMAKLFGENKLNRNGLREVASLLKDSPSKAHRRYKRWREIASKSSPSNLTDFDNHLATLCELEAIDALPFDKHSRKSPLIDLLTITALSSQSIEKEV